MTWNTLSLLLPRAAHLAAALVGTAAIGGSEPIVLYTNASENADVSFILSRDGSTVVRSYFPDLKSPVVTDRWTIATGVVRLPSAPDGDPWIASSVNSRGDLVGGRTNPSDFLANAVLFDAASGAFVAGAGAYETCVVAAAPPLIGLPSRAFLGDGAPSAVYRWTPGAFTPYSLPTAGPIPQVMAVAPFADICGGASYSLVGGEVRAQPFRCDDTAGESLIPLSVPAPDVSGEVIFMNWDASTILMRTWRTLPDGSQRFRLVRRTSSEDQILELPGGASTLKVWGANDALDTIVFSATTPTGASFPQTVWVLDEGFRTAVEFLASRGIAAPTAAAALGISGDSETFLASLTNDSLVLFTGLDSPSCGSGGSCFVAGPTAGCNDAECCGRVCEFDPYCCSVKWDTLCVQGAEYHCLGCGDPANGACTEVHANPGCADAECCTSVCAVDSFCCSTSWDALCADRALATCRSGETCADAILLSNLFPNTFTIDTTGVVPDGVAAGCGVNDTRATWRILRATCSGMTTIRLCASGALTSQATIAAYRTCGGLSINCTNSSGGACLLSPFGASLTFFTVAGEEYLIRFSAENGAAILGTATLSPVECAQVCGSGGPCNEAHGPGCSDSICCESVCSFDSYCCAVAWDSLCVSTASQLCFDPADLNGDGSVNAADLSILLGAWGTSGVGDIDGDGTVGAADLALLLSAWG